MGAEVRVIVYDPRCNRLRLDGEFHGYHGGKRIVMTTLGELLPSLK
jgi:hypothetical protein